MECRIADRNGYGAERGPDSGHHRRRQFFGVESAPGGLAPYIASVPPSLPVDQRIRSQRCRRGAAHRRSCDLGAREFHYAAILLVTVGFAALTAASVVQDGLIGPRDGGGKRLAGAMVLFLFAISFAHFGSAHDIKAWSGEAALHHAGIPLALFVLLQDYRFLLLDAFIRFLVNGLLAAFAVWLSLVAEAKLGLVARAAHDPFYAGLIFTSACIVLSLFGYLRVSVQRFLTKALFLRSNPERTISNLRAIGDAVHTEADYLSAAAKRLPHFLRGSVRESPFTATIPGRRPKRRWR